jgi:hypothetical protein
MEEAKMIKLTGSVGRMGVNKKHDVALVQRIMGAIKIQTRLGRRPIWSKKPDGRYTREMEPAIMCLQEHMGMKPSGKLECTIQTMNALTKVAPRELRTATSVPSTTVSLKGPSDPGREAMRIANETKASAPFPLAERRHLARAYRSLGPGHNICLERKKDWVTSDGRFATELEIDGKLSGTLQEKKQVHQLICRFITVQGIWEKGNPNDLKFRSKRQLKCLKSLGTGPLSGKDKKLLGLTSPPRDPVLIACAKGCAGLIRSGQIDKTAGAAEFEVLLQTISAPSPNLAKQIGQAAGRAGASSTAVQLTWVNPTGHGIRQIDAWGSGAFGASRDGGARQHLGVDYIAALNQSVLAAVDGTIYRLGFPYANDLSYRYVGIETAKGHQVREMYVDPAPNIQPGAKVSAGDVIGTYQSLQKRFPSITEHIHLDIRLGGTFIDPTSLIP